MTELTQEYLKECFDYNPETGEFVWKERPNSHFKSEKSMKSFNKKFAKNSAGFLNKEKQCYTVTLDGKLYPVARLAFFILNGRLPSIYVDHIDGDKKNLKATNIREMTKAEMVLSLSMPKKNNKFNLLGVSAHKSRGKTRYQASAVDNGNRIHLGLFKTPEEAHKAYVEFKRQLTPEFCAL